MLLRAGGGRPRGAAGPGAGGRRRGHPRPAAPTASRTHASRVVSRAAGVEDLLGLVGVGVETRVVRRVLRLERVRTELLQLGHAQRRRDGARHRRARRLPIAPCPRGGPPGGGPGRRGERRRRSERADEQDEAKPLHDRENRPSKPRPASLQRGIPCHQPSGGFRLTPVRHPADDLQPHWIHLFTRGRSRLCSTCSSSRPACSTRPGSGSPATAWSRRSRDTTPGSFVGTALRLEDAAGNPGGRPSEVPAQRRALRGRPTSRRRTTTTPSG